MNYNSFSKSSLDTIVRMSSSGLSGIGTISEFGLVDELGFSRTISSWSSWTNALKICQCFDKLCHFRTYAMASSSIKSETIDRRPRIEPSILTWAARTLRSPPQG